VHHQRSVGWNGLDDAVQAGLVEAPRQCQDPRAQSPIDPIAELNDKRGVSGRQNPEFRHVAPNPYRFVKEYTRPSDKLVNNV
jgi:hypothetical protein